MRTATTTIFALALAAAPALAQDRAFTPISLGEEAFRDNCAACHGFNAKGTGAVAAYLSIPTPDLTKLSEKAGGAFPFSEVYQLIDGRKAARTHGEFTEMPVWGNYFMESSLADQGLNPKDAAHVVQGRILSLVYYLQSIQD